MENTRSKIMDILRRRREATVEELTETLALAPATVRRHLDILQRDGYIGVRPVRRQTGRPHYAFSLTEAGEDLFPQHYVRVTNRVLDEIVSLDSTETAGKSGRDLARLIFERMADRLAESYAPRVTATTFGERVDQVASILNSEGMSFDVVPRGDAYLLLGRGCPCRRVTDRHEGMCSHDERLLARLLDADVEPVEPEPAEGESYCAYLVKQRADRALPKGPVAV